MNADKRAEALVYRLSLVPDEEPGETWQSLCRDLNMTRSVLNNTIAHARWKWGNEVVTCHGVYIRGWYKQVYRTANTVSRSNAYMDQYERDIRTRIRHDLVMASRHEAKWPNDDRLARRKRALESSLILLENQ